ncbi:unnamed protein product [Cylicocyclus nassatus]|uniref:Uncharacterized protein n=1 Tax=Cylicocyclus nassatus TaxID=53992 RepID=A0AA36H5A8_CYLNA|nr:unnamed protein product [Cylicocyclus nassatus]
MEPITSIATNTQLNFLLPQGSIGLHDKRIRRIGVIARCFIRSGPTTLIRKPFISRSSRTSLLDHTTSKIQMDKG